MTKIVCVESSARDSGLTATTAKACLEGAGDAGVETELVQLKDLTLERCRMCDEKGWGLCRTEGGCAIEDDFAGLVKKLRAADGYVFATPVYFSDLSESMKAFTDRLRRGAGFDKDNRPLGNRPVVAFACAGGGGGGTTHCMDQLERMLNVCGGFVMDLIPVARRNKHYKPDVARIVGRALAEAASRT
jgi:multimeric flavodoxin WrbA